MNIKHQGTKIVAKELNIAQSNMICQSEKNHEYFSDNRHACMEKPTFTSLF